jgi:hypothetical protein
VEGGGEGLNNEGLHNLNVSPNIIRVSISRRMRRAGNVVRMREMGNVY